jgi:hypothetical protein
MSPSNPGLTASHALILIWISVHIRGTYMNARPGWSAHIRSIRQDESPPDSAGLSTTASERSLVSEIAVTLIFYVAIPMAPEQKSAEKTGRL